MNGIKDSLEYLKQQSFAVAVDAHTAGEPIRVVLKGCRDELTDRGTMVDRQMWMKENNDEFRTRTMQEPRGHAAMFGAIVMEPARPEADVGVLFPYPAGYADMCGHGSIGVATVLSELGIIPTEPESNKIVLDTPAGLVETIAHYENGGVKKVDLFGTPSFFLDTIQLDLDGKVVEVALSFGGNYFGIVRAEKFDLSVSPEDLPQLNHYAHEILEKVNAREDVQLVHPETGELPLERIRFVEGEGGGKNVVIHEGAVIDRSPCGTGTCSQVAWEYEKGDRGLGEGKLYKSIIDTEFHGTAVKEKSFNGREAIIPKVTGESHITGLNYFVASDDDPLTDGFSIGHA